MKVYWNLLSNINIFNNELKIFDIYCINVCVCKLSFRLYIVIFIIFNINALK